MRRTIKRKMCVTTVEYTFIPLLYVPGVVQHLGAKVEQEWICKPTIVLFNNIRFQCDTTLNNPTITEEILRTPKCK